MDGDKRNFRSDDIERPVPSEPSTKSWGSDGVAAVLKLIDIPYVALNPGASYRGFHDSLVNYLGNKAPQMLLCLHEEHTVAIAQGYAKITGKPMAAIVHSNVGLMHASMAIFNAWCDRQPVILFGATGPVDAAKRRPWIDWLHTTQDQAGMIRNFIKWDAQPASVAAAQEAVLRANLIARTAPKGPVYINLDVSLQEQEVKELPPTPDVSRFQPPPSPAPTAEHVERAAKMLVDAKNPVMFVGRCGRDEAAWKARIELAEAIGCKVATDVKTGSVFPSTHPLHAAGPMGFVSPAGMKMMAEADVILSLDWIDLGGALKSSYPGGKPVTAKVIQISMDQHLHTGWNMEHFGLPPVDISMLTEPDAAVPSLLAAIRRLRPKAPALPTSGGTKVSRPPLSDLDKATIIEVPMIATTLKEAVGNDKVTLLKVPTAWRSDLWDVEHPLDALGADGGAGIGSGPGLAVGAALALRGKGRLPIAVMGDGDFSMGMSAIWTAAHYEIPLMFILANNRSYFNDELHQDRVARERGRPPENRWIGQAIREPDLDFATIARGQGCVGIGPVEDPKKLLAAIKEGVAAMKSGKVVVIDVRVATGYDPSTANSILKRD